MKVLSLFDGISCARVALDRSGIPVEVYYASEIDKHAINISQKNWKDIIQLGDITDIKMLTEVNVDGYANPGVINVYQYKIPEIDLLIGGSPCQDLSIAGKRKGLAGERSGLFYEYARILNEVKPKFFILENVNSMSKEAKETITKELFGIEPIMIDAGLVSAQQRKRLFWVGKLVGDKYDKVHIDLPEDRNIMPWDIIEDMEEKDIVYQYRRTYWREIKSGKIPTLTANMGTGGRNVPYIKVKEATKKGYAVAFPGDTVDVAFPNSTTRRGRVGQKIKNLMTANTIQIFNGKELRPLTPEECEKCQSLPVGYTDGFPKTKRLHAIGNAFNVDIIAHILTYLK